MKTTLTLLLASTALSAAIGLPALAAIQLAHDAPALLAPNPGPAALLTPAGWFGDDEDEGEDDDEDHDDEDHDDEDHDDEDHDGDDDDGDDGDDEDDDEDDDHDDACDLAPGDDSPAAAAPLTPCLPGTGNPAPAGTAPPPANGLFGTGAPPVAVTN